MVVLPDRVDYLETRNCSLHASLRVQEDCQFGFDFGLKETGHDSSGCDHHRFGQWAVIWLADSHGFSHDLGCVAEFETYRRRVCPQSVMNSVLNQVRLI